MPAITATWASSTRARKSANPTAFARRRSFWRPSEPRCSGLEVPLGSRIFPGEKRLERLLRQTRQSFRYAPFTAKRAFDFLTRKVHRAQEIKMTSIAAIIGLPRRRAKIAFDQLQIKIKQER